MAHAKLGPVLGAIAGDLGSVNFCRRGARLFVQAKRRPSPAQSEAQVNARAGLSHARAMWASLTSDEQDKWRNYAWMNTRADRLGQKRTLSAYQWFAWWLPYGEAGVPYGRAAILTPIPIQVQAETPFSLSLSFSAAGTFDIDTGTSIFGAYWQALRIWIAPGFASNRLTLRSWRCAGVLEYDALPVDCKALLEAAGVYLREGQWFRIRVVNLMQGVPNYWPSPPCEASGLVGP